MASAIPKALINNKGQYLQKNAALPGAVAKLVFAKRPGTAFIAAGRVINDLRLRAKNAPDAKGRTFTVVDPPAEALAKAAKAAGKKAAGKKAAGKKAAPKKKKEDGAAVAQPGPTPATE